MNEEMSNEDYSLLIQSRDTTPNELVSLSKVAGNDRKRFLVPVQERSLMRYESKFMLKILSNSENKKSGCPYAQSLREYLLERKENLMSYSFAGELVLKISEPEVYTSSEKTIMSNLSNSQFLESLLLALLLMNDVVGRGKILRNIESALDEQRKKKDNSNVVLLIHPFVISEVCLKDFRFMRWFLNSAIGDCEISWKHLEYLRCNKNNAIKQVVENYIRKGKEKTTVRLKDFFGGEKS